MRQKFFITPFAFSGDQTVIPDVLQPSGAVSFTQGWPFDYQRDPSSDPDAKPVNRQDLNYLMFVVTQSLRQYQTCGIPEFITKADNGGPPYPYGLYAMVLWSASGEDPMSTYVSMVVNNVATPDDSTKWKTFGDFISSFAPQSVPVGACMDFPCMIPPVGFVARDGSILSRTVYSNLWTFAQASGNLLDSDAEWVEATKGKFSPGDGVTTFRVPDQRGEFVRSWDNNAGIDIGREIGSWQGDALQNITGVTQIPSVAGTVSGAFARTGGSVSGTGQSSQPNYYVDFDASRVARTAAETRGRNIAYLACIKY
jgi:microcystin-dependent protein